MVDTRTRGFFAALAGLRRLIAVSAFGLIGLTLAVSAPRAEVAPGPVISEMPFDRPTIALDRTRIYFDLNYSNDPSVAQSIALGFRTGLLDSGMRASPQNPEQALANIEFIERDSRGYPRRSADTVRLAMNDPGGLALVGGLTSNSYVLNRSILAQSGVVTLLPWATESSLTRLRFSSENRIFRLSIDKSAIAPFLVKSSEKFGCNRLALLHGDTFSQLTGGLNSERRHFPIDVFLVARIRIPEYATATMIAAAANDIVKARVDCVILQEDGEHSPAMINALAMAGRFQVFTTWNALAPGMQSQLTEAARDRIQLRIVQSCELLQEQQNNPQIDRALRLARSFDPDVHSLAAMPSAGGFARGYDLGLLTGTALHQAISSPGWGPEIEERRLALSRALETPHNPIEGILRVYPGFSEVSISTPFGHEALGAEDLCLVGLDAKGGPVALPKAQAEREVHE